MNYVFGEKIRAIPEFYLDKTDLVNIFKKYSNSLLFSKYVDRGSVLIKSIFHSVDLPYVQLRLYPDHADIYFKRLVRISSPNSPYIFSRDISFREFIEFYLSFYVNFKNKKILITDELFADYLLRTYLGNLLNEESYYNSFFTKIQTNLFKFAHYLRLDIEDQTVPVLDSEEYRRINTDQENKIEHLISERIKYLENTLGISIELTKNKLFYEV